MTSVRAVVALGDLWAKAREGSEVCRPLPVITKSDTVFQPMADRTAQDARRPCSEGAFAASTAAFELAWSLQRCHRSA